MDKNKARNKIITIGVGKEFKSFLEDTAKQNGLYVSDLARRIITKGLKDKAFLDSVINQDRLPKKAFVVWLAEII